MHVVDEFSNIATAIGIRGIELYHQLGLRNLCPLHWQRYGNLFNTASKMWFLSAVVKNWIDLVGSVRQHGRFLPTTMTPQSHRAHDKDRDGFVISGGGGVFSLEELEHCQGSRAKKLC